jgi:hypothetical protein
MIYQLPINLDIKDRNVQVIFDLETGLYGFTKLINNETIEYYFNQSPIEFLKAFFKTMEPFIAEKSLVNFKICRKDSKMKRVNEILFEK